MPNRLATETSPYLLQHANNPVDWYPWGDEALGRARTEDKPILLSIGYAACHWCHVMEHESFENEATARLMNEHFVSIKVDREERPDLDGIYMQSVQAMTGHGGWPMTVFLTPDGAPFFAGTYFPPEDRQGMPSFRRVLEAVAEAYRDRRADVTRTAAQVRELFVPSPPAPVADEAALSPVLLDRAFRGLARQFDARRGGFGGSPKFPQTMCLEAALRHWSRTHTEHALEIALSSFRAMARGGIYDQIGGGFARYAVDAAWLVPHFEKMLYDNALLARLGVHLWQATKDAEVRRVTEETLDWALREMRAPEGGFYSSLDADSEGEEGKFYLWSMDEMTRLLGEDASLAIAYWGATPLGNFEGHNILYVPHEPGVVAARNGVTRDHLDAVIARARQTLSAARAERVWPARDEKILSSWNGLMLRALADAARALDRDDYRAAARQTADFLWRTMVRDGRVLRAHRAGVTKVRGFLEDYAALALGFLAVYELTFDAAWLHRARTLAESIDRLFWDSDRSQYFDTASDAETLITRPRDITDNAVPSGHSLTAELLALLAEYFDLPAYRARARQMVASLADPIAAHPLAFGHLLCVADLVVLGTRQLALVGDAEAGDFNELAREAARRYSPALVLAGGVDEEIPLLRGRTTTGGRATAYLCHDYVCELPVTDAGALATLLAAP